MTRDTRRRQGTRGSVRRALGAALGLFCLIVAIGIAIACRPTSLDLGANDIQPNDGASPTIVDAGGESSNATNTSLEEKLRARCKEPNGSLDRYVSASELMAKITTRFYICTSPDLTPLDPQGLEINTKGEWHRLDWADNRHDALVASTANDGHGEVTCVAFSDPDAGAGLDGGPKVDAATSTMTVPCNDSTPRRGIFVYLNLDPNFGTTHVLSFELEKTPRRAFASEVGPSSQVAELVPAD